MGKVRLVLVETRNSRNLGACARLVSNFAVREVALVRPRAKTGSKIARIVATPKGEAALRKMKAAPDLAHATRGTQIAVGFTRRMGKIRASSVRFEDLKRLVAENSSVSLVFGNESNGLSLADLRYCSHVCVLETSEVHPSLNLSHAVAVVLSQVYEPVRSKESSAADLAGQTEHVSLFDRLAALLNRPGAGGERHQQEMLARIKNILLRARLTRREVRLLHGFFGILGKS